MPIYPRTVLIAPDKFKGSLDAVGVAEAVARGLRRAIPGVRALTHPIADGGEGTIELVVRSGFRDVAVPVHDALGRRISATFALRGDTAVIQMSAAAGLWTVGTPSPESALRSSTYGVGELLRAALDAGAKSVIVGIGGSATTDGGAGALQALGASIADRHGAPVSPGGQGLLDAHRLDLSGLDSRVLRDAELMVACDVEGVLTGSDGAATVFSPQKGADPDTARLLELALVRWADLVAETTGQDLRMRPGAGAAGGLAFGLSSVLGASIVPGIDILLDLSRFDDLAAGCDLVIVGEGSLDAQSLMGKGPIGVARRAARLGVPCVAIVGQSSIAPQEAMAAGLAEVIAVSEYVGTERSMVETAESIETVVAEVVSGRSFLAG